jgi:hypothetical protein
VHEQRKTSEVAVSVFIAIIDPGALNGQGRQVRETGAEPVRPQDSPQPLEDSSRARGRRLHGRGLRDRRAARARSAGREPHVNEFDVYVGTSAGSFIASLAANGVTPEEMMRVVNQQVPTPFRDIDLGTLLRPNYLDFARAPRLLPLRVAGIARTLASNLRSVSMMDIVVGLAEGLPAGVYDGRASRTTWARCSATSTAAPTSACSARALPAGHRPRHL